MTDIGPGDIVICIDANPDRSACAPLTEGARYRIRFADDARHNGGLEPGVWLEGIISRMGPFGREVFYRASRFRPLRKSDSEIFREMIKIPEREKVI